MQVDSVPQAGEVERSGRLPYSPGFDGLRGVACLAVMFFHAELLHVTGGFLGVSIFIMLSGFSSRPSSWESCVPRQR